MDTPSCAQARTWDTGSRYDRYPALASARPAPRDAPAPPGRPRSGRPSGAVADLGRARRSGRVSCPTTTSAALVRDPAAMTDIPGRRAGPARRGPAAAAAHAGQELDCDDGATRKTLWRLHDGALVESVLMGYPDRVTVCVCSQAGCGMACPFCATGQAGLTRNLSTAEIVDQVVWFAGLAASGAVPGSPARLSRRRLHGHGRAAGQLQPGDRRGPPAHRPGPRGARAVPAAHHRLNRRSGPGHAAPGRRGSRGDSCAVSARAR